MQDYKYSYQDWIEGKLEPLALHFYHTNEQISLEDYMIIRQEQENAYLKRVKESLEIIKGIMRLLYNDNMVKDQFLAYKIEDIQEDLDLINEENPTLKEDVIQNRANVIWGKLTRQEVELYLYSDWSDVSFVYEQVMDNCYFKYKDFTHIDYILKANLLTWLKWFQKQEENSQDEPSTHYPAQSYRVKELVSESILRLGKYRIRNKQAKLEWPDLFKNPKMAGVILGLIDEHLSSTGQWISEPKGRYLVALYTELQSKGYLKSSLSAPKIAVAFNTQFDTDLTPKNFQPYKVSQAEDKREYFKNIIPISNFN